MKRGIWVFGIVFLYLIFGFNLVDAATNVTECEALNSADTTYTLNQSIEMNGDCIQINATNITLDCQGYNITFGDVGWGIFVVTEDQNSGFDNVTVKNCLLIQNDTGTGESAIFFGEGSNNSVVYNNTIMVFGLGTVGILFEGTSVDANVSLNNITTSGINGTGVVIGTGGSGANIVSNIVVTSANDSSGIKMEDDSSGTIYNNTITVSGNLSTVDGMGGIFLEVDTSDVNVSSNNITTSGSISAGIFVWGSNHSIDNNIITASGEQGDGIYMNDATGTNLTSNIITISGISADGIHSEMSEDSSLLFYNNVITTSANYSYGIFLQSDNDNNISSNNITTSGNISYGIYFNQSHNVTIANNIIKTGESDSYVLYLLTSANEIFYNNIFNTSTSDSGVHFEDADVSYFNTTETLSTNILGRPYIGGNFWTNNASTGYSDTCIDIDGDYLCDDSYVVVSGLENTDYLPLANHTNLISACGTLSTANKFYYLNQSVSSNGTCFNITANNITLLSNGTITGNTTGHGINITGYNDTTIIGGTFSNFSNGIYLHDSSNNAIYILIINNSAQDAVLLEGETSDDNNFTTVIVINTNDSFYDINFSTAGIDGTWIAGIFLTNYTFAGAGGKVNFKEPSYGEIVFLEAINGSGTDLSSDVDIESNSIFVNSSSNSGLNKSANITLYSISYTDPKPQYSSDGDTYADCTSTSDPVCNELGFSGNNFVFNVSHFTYFRAAEAYTADDDSTPSSSGGYPNYRPTEEELEKGYQKVLRKNWRVTFKVENVLHIFKVEDITETSAKVSISSETQEATFLVGEEKKFELSGDGYYDVLVRLDSVDATNKPYLKASFTIQTIHEEIVSQQEGEEGEEGEAAQEGEGEKEKTDLTWLWILIVVIVIFILFGWGRKKLRK